MWYYEWVIPSPQTVSCNIIILFNKVANMCIVYGHCKNYGYLK